jgi:hypothetical protein
MRKGVFGVCGELSGFVGKILVLMPFFAGFGVVS